MVRYGRTFCASTQHIHPRTATAGSITDCLQLASIDNFGPVEHPSIGRFTDKAKFTDYSRILDVVCFIKIVHEPTAMSHKFIQHLAVDLGPRVDLPSIDCCRENIADYCRQHRDITGINCEEYTAPCPARHKRIAGHDGETAMSDKHSSDEVYLLKHVLGDNAAAAPFLSDHLPALIARRSIVVHSGSMPNDHFCA